MRNKTRDVSDNAPTRAALMCKVVAVMMLELLAGSLMATA